MPIFILNIFSYSNDSRNCEIINSVPIDKKIYFLAQLSIAVIFTICFFYLPLFIRYFFEIKNFTYNIVNSKKIIFDILKFVVCFSFFIFCASVMFGVTSNKITHAAYFFFIFYFNLIFAIIYVIIEFFLNPSFEILFPVFFNSVNIEFIILGFIILYLAYFFNHKFNIHINNDNKFIIIRLCLLFLIPIIVAICYSVNIIKMLTYSPITKYYSAHINQQGNNKDKLVVNACFDEFNYFYNRNFAIDKNGKILKVFNRSEIDFNFIWISDDELCYFNKGEFYDYLPAENIKRIKKYNFKTNRITEFEVKHKFNAIQLFKKHNIFMGISYVNDSNGQELIFFKWNYEILRKIEIPKHSYVLNYDIIVFEDFVLFKKNTSYSLYDISNNKLHDLSIIFDKLKDRYSYKISKNNNSIYAIENNKLQVYQFKSEAPYIDIIEKQIDFIEEKKLLKRNYEKYRTVLNDSYLYITDKEKMDYFKMKENNLNFDDIKSAVYYKYDFNKKSLSKVNFSIDILDNFYSNNEEKSDNTSKQYFVYYNCFFTKDINEIENRYRSLKGLKKLLNEKNFSALKPTGDLKLYQLYIIDKITGNHIELDEPFVSITKYKHFWIADNILILQYAELGNKNYNLFSVYSIYILDLKKEKKFKRIFPNSALPKL